MEARQNLRNASWLSLVAETAGVTGATVARVDLRSREVAGPVRVAIQIRDTRGAVAGSTYWYGDGDDLDRGVQVDLGCDILLARGCVVCAWVDEACLPVASSTLSVPAHASVGQLEKCVALKLMLRGAQPMVGPQAA